MNLEKHSIPYGKKNLKFILKRADRKTLAIHVLPNMNVEVVAPNEANLEKIYKKIKQRARWIKTQQIFFEQFHPKSPARQYESGETHLYLGRQYRLKVCLDEKNGVKLSGRFLWIQTNRPKDKKNIQNLVESWFTEKAHDKFKERLQFCLKNFQKQDDYIPRATIIRTLTSRWGSMTPNKRLVLNKKLIHAPVSSIDYVITHELCHMVHPNHSKQFWKMLKNIMPDWEKRKLKLERICIV